MPDNVLSVSGETFAVLAGLITLRAPSGRQVIAAQRWQITDLAQAVAPPQKRGRQRHQQ